MVHGGRSVGEGQAVYNWSERRRMTTKFTSGQADWTFSLFRDVAKTSLKSVYRPYRPTMLRNMRIFGTHVLEYTELLFEQDMR